MTPGKRLGRIVRMKAVEREYGVAMLSQDYLAGAFRRDSSILGNHGLNQADFDAMGRNLSTTYLIRLFAEFETGLRSFWRQGLGRNSAAPVRDLMESVSARRSIEDTHRANAHAVRKYRNKVVHEEDLDAGAVSIGEARKSLCIFFSRLPADW